ncbi:MAG: hypothetical protein QW390_04635 [Candidatus Bathyarchaeia archaeon]
MSVAVTCSDEDFRALRKHLDERGVAHHYYLRRSSDPFTTFYLEATPLTEFALRCIRDFAKGKGIKAEVEIDGKLHDLSSEDLEALFRRASEAQRRGGLVRGYHY